MHCPHCQGYRLNVQELAPGLLAGECQRCHGVLVALAYYRHWLEQQTPSLPVAKQVTELNQQSEPAVCLCPKCQRFMGKFEISAQTNHKIDFCAACEELWLDKGEWQLLLQLDLHKQLSDIVTLGWQNQIKRQRQRAFTESHYQQLLGDEDFAQARLFKNWLDQHPQQQHIKQYLITRLPH